MTFKYDGSKAIKAVRTKRLIELNIDVRETAKLLGVSAATVSRFENGKTPDLLTLASICYWTGTNIYDCIEPIKKTSRKPQK